MRSELFIGGTWRDGAGGEFASINPATAEVVWRGRAADAGDVARAAEAAQAAFPAWARTCLEDRIRIAEAFAKLVRSRAQEFAEIISREMGKARWDSESEVASVVGKIALSVRAQAERAGAQEEAAAFGRLELEHRPHGVLAVFGPFNFPAHLPNGHITPALLAGNTLVFKPSELAPGVGALMVAAWEEAGLPPGVLNLVQGARETGEALLDAPHLRGVLFTGSERVGTAIHRHFAGRPDILLALEMGGNNPLIAWSPYDVEACANLIVHSAFITSGQRCSCARRLFAPEGRDGDRLIEALVEMTAKIAPAIWNAEPQPFQGPLVHAKAADNALAFEADLIGRGAKPLLRAKCSGAFMHPALINATDVNAPDEECFAPLLQVIRVPSFEGALIGANQTRFGLSAGLLSEDPALWARARSEMHAGILNWNRPTTGASGAMPFGGPGRSGSLRPSGYYAADYVAYPMAGQIAPKLSKIAAPGLPL